jgi:DNA-binding response OmpR family regulator
MAPGDRVTTAARSVDEPRAAAFPPPRVARPRNGLTLVSPFRHYTILLVDDDTASLETYARFLEVEGYWVRKAPDAATAITEAEIHRPDAVVLDLRLPDQATGLKVLRQFRSHIDPPLPVGIVTGDYGLEPSVEREIRQLGASLTFKPIWLDEMLALVQRLLR